MNNLFTRQLQFERDTWLRSLKFLEQENTYLKNRVAEILKSDVNKQFLDEIESFQTLFINSDNIISMLKHDLQEQEALLKNNSGNDSVFRLVINKHSKQRDSVAQIEGEFSKLKFSFNNYLNKTFKHTA